MLKASSAFKSGAAVIVAAGLVLGASLSASAEPDTTADRTYRAVGSDTIQDVWNGLSNGTSPVVGLNTVASYNAFPSPGTIKTYSTGHTFDRPSGSGNGVKALSAAWDPSNHSWGTTVASAVTLDSNDISFSRSSSAPAAPLLSTDANANLVYIPFARDAVSVAYNGFTGDTAITFSRAELKAIYGGSDENTTSTVTYQTTGDLLPIFGGHVLHPKLPQSGSGTRSFFLGAGGANIASLASYVEPTASTLAENNGTAIDAITGDTRDGWLIPFSAAQWIAQKNAKVTNTTGSLLIASLDQDNSTSTTARTVSAGTAPNLTPGTLYGPSTTAPAAIDAFARDTYSVIPRVSYNATSGSGLTLKNLLTLSGTGQLGSAAAKVLIQSYGFLAYGSGYISSSSNYQFSNFVH